MLRRTMHTFAAIGLLGIAVTFATGTALGANAPSSTHLPQKTSVGSGEAKKSVEPIKTTGVGTPNTNKSAISAPPLVNPHHGITPVGQQTGSCPYGKKSGPNGGCWVCTIWVDGFCHTDPVSSCPPGRTDCNPRCPECGIIILPPD
jgi:hypothetical protein